MILYHEKFKNKYSFFVFPFFLCMSTQANPPDKLYETKEEIGKDSQNQKPQNNTNLNRPKFATVQSLFLKSLIETG